MSNEVETLDDRRALAPQSPVNETTALVSMIERAASNPSVDVSKFQQLLEMRERVEANAARKEFNSAVSLAKGEIGPVIKDKTVDFSTTKGRTNYRYEGFDSVARAVDPVLNRYGMSYRFRSAQEGDKLRVTCILSHRDGYSEETTLEAGCDHSGNKNSIQAIGSAVTYLQRYTLKLALGLSTTADDDGRMGNDADAPETISLEQRARLIGRITEVGADPVSFLDYCGVERLDDLRADQFALAMRALDAKARSQGAAK